jgi:hypothetical protein
MSGTQIEASKILSHEVLSQADERASKVLSHEVLVQIDERASKILGYKVLSQLDSRISKILGYLVIAPQRPDLIVRPAMTRVWLGLQALDTTDDVIGRPRRFSPVVGGLIDYAVSVIT